MKLSTVISVGEEVRSSYEYRDPERLCEETGVISLLFPMGTARRSIKGFILHCGGNVAITVNSDLSPEMIRVVRYHELAHYLLHIRTGLQETIQDCDIYDARSEAEYEANLLAAELQLEDEEVMEALEETGEFYRAAEVLRVPPQLLDFKLRLLREKGREIPEIPLQSAGSYLAAFSEGA